MRCAGIGTKAGVGPRRNRAAPVCACAGAALLAVATPLYGGGGGDGALAGSVTACGRPTPLAYDTRGVSAPRARAATRGGELAACGAGSSA